MCRNGEGRETRLPKRMHDRIRMWVERIRHESKIIPALDIIDVFLISATLKINIK